MSDMSLQMAREIITQASKYDAWEGDPAQVTDDQAVKDAKELVQLSTNAYNGAVRSDAVMEILFACKIQPPADEPRKYDEVYARHPDAAPPAAQQPAEQETTAAPPTNPLAAAAQASGNAGLDAFDKQAKQINNAGAQTEEERQKTGDPGFIDINSIVPGYDDAPKKKLEEAIMSAAASGDLNEDEWEKIKAYEAVNEERKSILSLEPQFKKPEPPPSAPASAPASADTSNYGDPAALAAAYQDGTVGTDRVTQQALPVPKKYEGEEPLLPIDITEESDKDLSRLTMRFHALEAHTIWLASQEEGRRDVCAGLSSDAWDDAFGREFARLKEGLDKETASAIENVRSEAKHSANSDESVRTWKTRERRHAAEARSLKALAEGYEKAAARLSREQTRREKLTGTPQG